MIGFFGKERNRTFGIIAALIVGISCSTFVIGYDAGIGYFLFCVVLTIVTGILLYMEDNLDIANFIYWGVVFLGITSVFFRLRNPIYLVAGVLLTPIMYIFLTMFSSKEKPKAIFGGLFYRMFCWLAYAGKFITALRVKKADTGERNNLSSVFIGVGIGVGLLLIIVPIMFSADMMFEEIFLDITGIDDIGLFIGRIFVMAIVTLAFFAFMYLITKRDKTVKEVKPKKVFGSDVGIIVLSMLIVIGFIYTCFAAIQFNYLFVGVKSVLPIDYSYAEYARNGYFELFYLSVINFVIIMVSVVMSRDAKGRIKKVVNILLTYFNLLNFYLIASSAYKMGLYQQKYGSTVLRLMVYLLLLFEAIMLILLAIKIIKRDYKLFRNAIYIGFAFWMIVSFINIESVVMQQNIQRFEKWGRLDKEYAVSLSEDVSDELYYLYNHDDFAAIEKQQLKKYFGKYHYDSRGYEYSVSDRDILEYNISIKKHDEYIEKLVK